MTNAEELRTIAHRLGNVPREATESREDMFNFLRRAKAKILVVADRVEANEADRGAKAKPQALAIGSARAAFYRRAKPRSVHSKGQLALVFGP